MVDDPVRPPMIHGSHFQVAFEFAESLLDIQQTLVMTQHLQARTLLHRFVGMEQKPPILVSFLSDQRFLTLPLQFSSLINVIGKILVRLESLQTSAHLAGQLLPIHLLSLYGCQPFELHFRFVEAALSALLIALLAPGTPSNDIALVLVAQLYDRCPIP